MNDKEKIDKTLRGSGFDIFKATDRERINEALRMMDEWEKEEKEAADWDYEANEMDQYVNLPEHTRKLLDCLGMLQGTLNTYEVKDDREKLEAIDKIFEAYPYESFSALIKDEEGDWVKNRKLIPMLDEIKAILEK